MRVGVQFQTHGVEPVRFAEVAHEAASLGVDGVFLWDHMVPFVGSHDDSAWETWSLMGSLTAVAASSSVTLGVLVSPLTFRHPQILARASATISRLSGRRFILGVGAGGFVHDDRLFGDERGTVERMNDFGSRLAELRDAVDEQNRRHSAKVVIWVGGDGLRRTVPLAARFGDGWSGFGPPERWSTRKEILDAIGTRSEFETSVLLTPMDEPFESSAWRSIGVDWLIRSLRPDGGGSFDLEPIRRLLDVAR
ncbi:MAG: LLM class flavin-dependent oxidoreductase [Ilumatobacteraceae bacterium]